MACDGVVVQVVHGFEHQPLPCGLKVGLGIGAVRRAAPAARLLVFACSYHVGPELFRKIAFGASLDAGRKLRVLGGLGLPADHPVSLDHPEGAYLDGLLLEA